MRICAFLCVLILSRSTWAAGRLEGFIEDWAAGTVTRIKTECALSRRQDNFHTAVTQTSLGEKMGVQKAELSRLMAGRQSLTLAQGLAIAEALRVKPEILLGFAQIRRYFKTPEKWDRFKLRFEHENFYSIFAEAMHPDESRSLSPKPKRVFRLAEISLNGTNNILSIRLKGHGRLSLMFRFDLISKQAKALAVVRTVDVDQYFFSTFGTTLEFLRSTGARKNGWPIRTLAITNLHAQNQPDQVVDLKLDLVRLNKNYSPVALRIITKNQIWESVDRIRSFRNIEITNHHLREVAPKFDQCGGTLIEDDIGRD